MTPLEISCRACASAIGEPCREWVDGRGMEPTEGFHAERIEDAAYWSGDRDESMREKTARAIEQVVNDRF